MILGASIDAGVPLESITSAIDAMNVEGVSITCKNGQRSGLTGKLVDIKLDEEGLKRHTINDFIDTVQISDLSSTVKTRAIAVFRRLAQAEAQVHHTNAEDVHLHELGTLDTLIDVVGSVVALDTLGVERVYSSPLPTGSGVINTEHGLLPVPTPATAVLISLARAPIVPAPRNATRTGEMVTPTGAAIITTLAIFEQPTMNLHNVGYGLGSREVSEYPNALGLWIGENNDVYYQDGTVLIETNIDDMTGETLGYVQQVLFTMGARDVWFTPIQMKKNRPATMLSVILTQDLRDQAIEILMRETTTLGLRVRSLTRYEAERKTEVVKTDFGNIPVKIKIFDGDAIAVSPEYESCKRIAEERNIPLQQVLGIVQREAERQLLG